MSNLRHNMSNEREDCKDGKRGFGYLCVSFVPAGFGTTVILDALLG